MADCNISKVKIDNPFKNIYNDQTDAILFAHSLIGTVRGKSANGLMIHSKLFNTVAIIDEFTAGKDTSNICQGVNKSVPIYSNLKSALQNHSAKVVIFLIPPISKWYNDIEIAAKNKLDIINTTFNFIKADPFIRDIAQIHDISYFDLRDVTNLQAYPNTDILNRKSKVVFVTGTDCGLGKRTAAYELTQEARRRGINATMYATGQTGLMIGERGTVIDALVIEFCNGVISQQITQLKKEGYELIFVEGQSDVFHPANSAMSLALLHGANPDCIVLVHDESRKVHKGFEEDSPLYKMHSVKRYIETLEMLSLPCGPIYKTVAIATIGSENIRKINEIKDFNNLEINDVRMPGGSEKILDSIITYLYSDDSKIKNYFISDYVGLKMQ
ncbi:DUF1611 domain-containing protein [Bacteroidota bacterium]